MVRIDQDLCIGCGTCVSLCPKMFEIREDMKAHLKEEGECENIDEVIDMCPVDAISE